jgi:coenzyme F420-0:L-glutamate ligase/coenzyme F420-1:gamma-L-glutamate ligase
VRLTVWAPDGAPEVAAGDDVAAILVALLPADGPDAIQDGDIVMVTSKVVAKAEGRVRPGPREDAVAEETVRVVARRGQTTIARTRHGLTMAAAGVDGSNVAPGHVVLLPVDPDASARRIQARLAGALGGRVGVVVTDTHGRAFRRGLVNVAIGVAGFVGLVDLRGGVDRGGRLLVASDQALADELAAAAGMLMAKAGGTPAVAVSGVSTRPSPGGAGALVRDPAADLFREPGGPAAPR